MDKTNLGRTGLKVSRLGLGLAAISRRDRVVDSVAEAGRVLHAALDGGTNFLDTAAPCRTPTHDAERCSCELDGMVDGIREGYYHGTRRGWYLACAEAVCYWESRYDRPSRARKSPLEVVNRQRQQS